MMKYGGRSLLALVLVVALVTGTALPPAIVADAQGNHGTISGTITKDQMKDTPPVSYTVNMGMQRDAKDGAYDAYFLKDDIQTVKIDVDEVNLNYMFQNAAKKPTVMTDQVTIGDKTIGYTGLKTKGNYTLEETINSDSDRFSFTINFGKYIKKNKGYEATQNFYGCSKISFNNFFFDKTMMKEYCALKLMTEMGVPTPQYGLAKLYINNKYYGVYFMVEAMDSSILEQYLGQPSDMISDYLMKPEDTRLQYDSALNSYKDAAGKFTMDSLAQALYKNAKGDYEVAEDSALAGQSGLWENDTDTLGDVAEMIPTVLTWEERLTQLSSGKDFSGKTIDVNSERYLELLGQIMDVDETVRYFATHSFIVQMDNMFANQRNYGLYVGQDGKSIVLPWDYDLGWGCFWRPSDAESVANWDVDNMFTPDLVQGSAASVYRDYPLFQVIYQNKSLMEKYHQYMKDCAKIASLGGKTSSGKTYEAGRFAAAIDTLKPEMQAAASEKLADHVYYIDSNRKDNSYRQCNQPSALLAGLPNLSKVIARRAAGVYLQLEGIRSTVCGYGCDMSTIGNAGAGMPSTGGNLTVVDDKTGIFATANYTQGMGMWRPNAVGPSLSVSVLAKDDPVYAAIKGKISDVVDMDVYRMTNTKSPSSSYQIYVPIPERLIPGTPYRTAGETYTYEYYNEPSTDLYSYSNEQETLKKLGKKKISEYMYSAETDSIQYIAVVKTISKSVIDICVLPAAPPAKVKSLKAKKGKRKVTLTWKKVSCVGYQIQYSTKKSFSAKKTKTKYTKKKKYVVKKLKKKKYYFRVRAYRKNHDGSKRFGPWSKVVKVKIRK